MGVECNVIIGLASSQAPLGSPNIQDFNHAWNQVKLNNNWYNVELTWFSSKKDLDFILVDDETFEKHYPHKEACVHSCPQCLPNRQSIYEKMKNIKNVLVAYDLGKRDTILQYTISHQTPDVEDSKSQEKSYDSRDFS